MRWISIRLNKLTCWQQTICMDLSLQRFPGWFHSQTLNVWYIYLHVAMFFYGKSREIYHTDVSENSGTPKSSILIGFSIINHPFWSTPIFGNTRTLSVWDWMHYFHFTGGPCREKYPKLRAVESTAAWRHDGDEVPEGGVWGIRWQKRE